MLRFAVKRVLGAIPTLFLIIAITFFKRELRLTLEDYQIYRARPGLSQINLTYDRGIMLGYGLPTKTDFVAEILNGNGIGGVELKA